VCGESLAWLWRTLAALGPPTRIARAATPSAAVTTRRRMWAFIAPPFLLRSVVARRSLWLLPALRGTGARALRRARAAFRGTPRHGAEPPRRVRRRRGPGR